MGDKSYLDRMTPYARKASQQTGIPTSVILAQWAIETAWGSSKGARERNNHGGISWGAGTLPSWSKAIALDKRPANEGGNYMNYRSIDDFVSDYVTVMKNPRYSAVRAAGQTPGLADDALALGKSPYAGGHYTSKGVQGQSLIDTIRANELWNYDHGGAVASGSSLAGTVKLNSPNVVTGKDETGQMYMLLLGAAAVAVMSLLAE